MQPVIMKYKLIEDKHEVVLPFPRTSFPLAFFSDNLAKCPNSLVTVGY